MNRIPWYPIPWPDSARMEEERTVVVARLSLREAGDMDLKTMPNPRVAEAVADVFPGTRFSYLYQEHTQMVHRDEDGDVRGRIGDGLVAGGDTDAVLGITVADCMPIFLWDPVTGARGILHSGWKGTGIAAEAVRLMRRSYGTIPEDLLVMLGPCIGSCCYDVPEERAAAFAAEFGNACAAKRGERWYLDLKAANLGILSREGVRHVLSMPECTRCDERFGSFRRQGKPGFTKMLALVGSGRNGIQG